MTTTAPTFGSLFSGIGGMDLGLERAGWRCIWQSEVDDYASRVLKRHWPDVPNLGDIRAIDWSAVERPDLIAGGFPCQDLSTAGKRAGIDGARSGLWSEFTRAVRELRPRFALVENVPGLLLGGLGRVLGDLAEIRYDAEWTCLSACAMGAPHMRKRVFIVAYPDGELGATGLRLRPRKAVFSGHYSERAHDLAGTLDAIRSTGGGPDGVPHRVDRLRGLGNAVVPQVAELIGRAILEAHHAHRD